MKRHSSVSMSVTPELERDVLNIRVSEASAALLNGIHIIESLIYPKWFEPSFIKMLKFERNETSLQEHKINMPDDSPIQEIVSWHITGRASDRIVNVVITSTFYTFATNRSGTRRITINGKKYLKPEYGGVTLEDIWQESGHYKKFLPDSVIKNGINICRVGKNNTLTPIAH